MAGLPKPAIGLRTVQNLRYDDVEHDEVLPVLERKGR